MNPRDWYYQELAQYTLDRIKEALADEEHSVKFYLEDNPKHTGEVFYDSEFLPGVPLMHSEADLKPRKLLKHDRERLSHLDSIRDHAQFAYKMVEFELALAVMELRRIESRWCKPRPDRRVWVSAVDVPEGIPITREGLRRTMKWVDGQLVSFNSSTGSWSPEALHHEYPYYTIGGPWVESLHLEEWAVLPRAYWNALEDDLTSGSYCCEDCGSEPPAIEYTEPASLDVMTVHRRWLLSQYN